MPSELSVERHLKHEVEHTLGGKCIKLMPWSVSGLPDRILFLPLARIELVETKTKKGRLRVQQKNCRRWLARLGFTVWYIHSRDQVDSFITWVQNRTFN